MASQFALTLFSRLTATRRLPAMAMTLALGLPTSTSGDRMATLLTDLSIPVAPPTTLDAATPDVLPYAIQGTTAEPSLAREIAGWQAGVVPPAEQENWMRQKLWAWLGRASCTGFFTQRSTKAIAIGGTLVASDVIRMSYNGHNNDYTVTSQDVIDGFDTVAANWAQQITEDSAIRSSLDSQGSEFGNMLVFYRSPGVAFPHAVTVSVVSGTTTVSASDLYGGTAGPLFVTSAPGGGDSLPLSHKGGASFGAEALPDAAQTAAISQNMNATAHATEAVQVQGECDISGVGTAPIVTTDSAMFLAVLPDNCSFVFNIQVVARRTNGAGVATTTTWDIKASGNKTAGTLTWNAISGLTAHTFDADDWYLYLSKATDTAIPVFATTMGSGDVTVSISSSVSSLKLLAGVANAAFNVHFSATARYTIGGVP